MSESWAYRMNQLGLARAKSEIEIVRRFGEVIKSSARSDLHRMVALRLVDSIRDIAIGDKHVQLLLPSKEIEETLKRLRGEG
jgi:hypothetical protein